MRFVTCALLASMVMWSVAGCDKEDAKKAGGAAGDAAKSAVNSAKDGAAKMTAELNNKVAALAKDYPQIGDIISKLKENKTEAADKSLSSLEATKDTLSAKVQAMLPTLRSIVDKVKAGAKFDMSMLAGLVQ